MKLIILYFLICVSLLSIGCSTVPENHPDCYNEKNKVYIRWGNYFRETKNIEGYLVNSNAELFDIKDIKDTTGLELGKVDFKKYCEVLNDLHKQITTSQLLNVPADTTNFIELYSISNGTRFLCQWNPHHSNIGNEGFNKIFDKLNVFLNIVE